MFSGHAPVYGRQTWRKVESLLLGSRCRPVGFLIEAEDVPVRIAEPGGDLGRVAPDGLHERTPVREDRVEGRGDAVDHDVEQKARFPGGRPTTQEPLTSPTPSSKATCPS